MEEPPAAGDPEFPLYLAGQIRGLTALTMALVRSHPNRRLLRRHIEAVDFVATAKDSATPVAEAYLEGYREIVDAVRLLLGDAATRRERRVGGELAKAAELMFRAAKLDPDSGQAAEKRALAIRAKGLAGASPRAERQYQP